MSFKIIGFLAASIGAILGLTTGVAMWTTQEWLPPLTPVLYLASVFLALFVALGIGWFMTTRQELQTGIGSEGESAEERGLKRLVMLASQVLLAVIGLALVSLWNVDRVRAEFVSVVADSHVRLEKPLKDPSPLVRLAACKQIFQRGWTFRAKDSLIASLNGEPKVAKACLDAAANQEWKGTGYIAKTLVDGWEAEMVASDDRAAPQMCEFAPWTPALDEFSGLKPEVRLLRCAATAKSDDIRHCCAEVLADRGDSLVEALGNPGDWDAETTTAVFAELVQYGFRPLSLSEGKQRVASTLGTDDRAIRRWVTELGCTHLDPATAQPELLIGFLPLIESQTCGLSAEDQLEYTSPVAWGGVCQEIFEASDDKVIEKLVCDAVQAAKVEKAIDEARLHIIAALRAPFMEKDADFISEGLASADQIFAEEKRGGGGGGIKESVSGYRVDGSYRYGESANQRRVNKEFKVTGFDDPTCKKLVFGRHSTGLAQLEDAQMVESFDCDRYDDDTTVQEYLDRNKLPSSEETRNYDNPFEHFAGEAAARHGASGTKAAKRGAEQYSDAFKNR